MPEELELTDEMSCSIEASTGVPFNDLMYEVIPGVKACGPEGILLVEVDAQQYLGC